MKLQKDKEQMGVDAPLHDPKSDRLDRAIFAQRIFKIIEGTPPTTNMTVGILGSWGAGKSTTMNFLRHYCQDAGHPTAIFNPWQFRNRDEAWQGFVVSIDRGIADWKGYRIGSFKRQRTVKKVSATFRKYTSVTQVGRWAGSLILKPLEGALEETKERVQKELNKALGEKRLFVFIDDLDRTEPEIVYDILMLLNEIVDLGRCIYVVGLDDNVAAQMISNKSGLDIPESKEFLEKIVKWPFRLPELSGFEWHELLDSEIERLDKNTKADALRAIIEFLPKNPRRLKHFLRYISGLHKSFLSRFDDNELNWKVLYLAQLLRIEYPEMFQKIIGDESLLEDITMGLFSDKLRESETPAWKDNVEKAITGLDGIKKERFLLLYGELRSSGGVLSIEHLRNHLLVIEAPDLFTWKEYYDFKRKLLPSSDDAIVEKLRSFAMAAEKSKHIERIREFVKTLQRDRDGLLSRAADAVDQETGMKPLLNEVKGVIRICFCLLRVKEFFEGHYPIFNREVFEEWYKLITKWANFQRPAEIYSEIRQLEAKLALKLAECMKAQASEALEVLLAMDRDPFGARTAFETTHQEISEVLEKALVVDIISRFKRVDGIKELIKGIAPARTYKAEKYLLFQDNPIMHNPAIYEELRATAQDASHNSVIQNNFYELAAMFFYAATEHLDWTERDKVIGLLGKKDFMDIIWSAAVARPMNLRAVGSLEEKRKNLIQNILKDENALPIPTWYKQRLKEAAKRA